MKIYVPILFVFINFGYIMGVKMLAHYEATYFTPIQRGENFYWNFSLNIFLIFQEIVTRGDVPPAGLLIRITPGPSFSKRSLPREILSLAGLL